MQKINSLAFYQVSTDYFSSDRLIKGKKSKNPRIKKFERLPETLGARLPKREFGAKGKFFSFLPSTGYFLSDRLILFLVVTD